MGDGGPALLAALNFPTTPKFDARGNLYFVDRNNYRIRRIDPQGVITTVAGDGIPLNGMDLEGPALERSLGYVSELAADAAGNVYFIEDGTDRIRRVTTAGRIEIFARPKSPSLLAADGSSVYVVERTDSFSFVIRRYASDGSSTPFAGYGPLASISAADDGQAAIGISWYQLSALAAAGGKVYLIQNPYPTRDPVRTRIRVIDENGVIHTLAGGQGGLGTADGPALPSMISPVGLAADAAGNVAFAESSNGVANEVLREVTAQSTLKTLAGATPKPAPDGTAARDAWYVSLSAIAFDRAGNLYLADSGACMIRKLGASGLLTTVAGTGKCGEAHPVSPATGPDLAPPVSIAVDSRNRVFMLDTFGNSYIITPDGKAAPSQFPPTLGQGKIAIDSKDRVYLSGLIALVRISPDGTLQYVTSPPSQPGVPPPGFGPTSITALGADPAGAVYFTGTYLGSQTDFIFRVNDDGTFTPVYGSTGNPLQLLNASSLAVDAKGRVWLARGLVEMVTASATISVGRQETGYSGDGGLAQMARFNASGVAFAPDGSLYVVDNNRVRRISGAPQPAAPTIAAGGIVNAFSYSGGAIAPGELITIFGSNFTSSALQVAALENNRIPFGLGAARVLFDGYPGPISAITPTQINVFASELISPGMNTKVTVQVDSLVSTPVSVPVVKAAPGFTPIVFNQDGTMNSTSSPATAGSIISLYGTGEGQVTPIIVPGGLVISTPFPKPSEPVVVTIDGRPAEILYAGAAPFEPIGVLQVNARVPDGVAAGALPVLVNVGGAAAKPLIVVVR